jgi:hypothetical protein
MPASSGARLFAHPPGREGRALWINLQDAKEKKLRVKNAPKMMTAGPLPCMAGMSAARTSQPIVKARAALKLKKRR